MKTYFLSYCLCILAITTGLSQDHKILKEVLSTSQAIYEDTAASYEVDLTYSIYRMSDPDNAQESYKGVYAKQRAAIYSQIGPMELVHIAGTYLQINHDEKVMLYSKIAETSTISQSPLSVLDYVDAFAKAEVTKTAEGWQCILSSPKEEQLTQLPFDKMILHIDSNYAIRKQLIYPLEKVMFSNVDGQSVLERPVVEIHLTPLKNFSKKDKMQLDTYVGIHNGEARPVVALKNYELIKV